MNDPLVSGIAQFINSAGNTYAQRINNQDEADTASRRDFQKQMFQKDLAQFKNALPVKTKPGSTNPQDANDRIVISTHNAIAGKVKAFMNDFSLLGKSDQEKRDLLKVQNPDLYNASVESDQRIQDIQNRRAGNNTVNPANPVSVPAPNPKVDPNNPYGNLQIGG